MAAITAAVVGTAVAVKGQRDQKKAQKKASDRQEDAAIQSAKVLGASGVEAEKDILAAQEEAVQAIGAGAEAAAGRIEPFTEGVRGFEQAQEQILSGLPISGPLADRIRAESTQAILSRPELFNVSGPIGAEVQRQGDLTVSGVTPGITQNLLTAGQQGLAAVGDVAGIRQRGFENLADIASSSGAQRSSVLVGQTPALQQFATSAQESRLLGDVAGQRANTATAQTLAGLGGTISQELDLRSAQSALDDQRRTNQQFDQDEFSHLQQQSQFRGGVA